jgi:shikimate 5-dehydrogenase
VSRSLATTTNSVVVTSGEDATGHVTDYYGILQNIVEYTFNGAKELKNVFFNVIGSI